ncbi:hypothetical protein ACFC1T_14685 [Kitasatospora sp. NPDC056076]
MDHDQLTEVIETALDAIENEVGIDQMEVPDLAASLATAILRAQSH